MVLIIVTKPTMALSKYDDGRRSLNVCGAVGEGAVPMDLLAISSTRKKRRTVSRSAGTEKLRNTAFVGTKSVAEEAAAHLPTARQSCFAQRAISQEQDTRCGIVQRGSATQRREPDFNC